MEEWHSEISTSYQQTKGGRTTGLDDLHTNGLDGIRATIKKQKKKKQNKIETVKSKEFGTQSVQIYPKCK